MKVDEVHSPEEKMKRDLFDSLIERRHGTSLSPPAASTTEDGSDFEEYEDDSESARVIPDIEDTVDSAGKLLNQQPAYDRMLHAEVALQLDDEMAIGKVTK